MPLVKRYNFQARQAILSSQLNTNFDDIITAYNAHQHTNTGTDAPLITSSGLAPGAVTATKFDTGAITLGYAQITSTATNSATSATAVAGLSATVTIPTGGRRAEISFYSRSVTNDGGGGVASTTTVSIWDGTVGSGTQLTDAARTTIGGSYAMPIYAVAVVTPAAGSKTYAIGLHGSSGAQVNSLTAGSTNPALILVKMI